MTASPQDNPDPRPTDGRDGLSGPKSNRSDESRETGGVDNLVREIRAGLSEISTRELDIRRREQEYVEQYRELRQAARRAAEQEIARERAEIAQQADRVNAVAADLVKRREQLAHAAEEIHAQKAEAEKHKAELERQSEHWKERLESLRGRRKQHREVLRRRIGTIRQREKELEKRLRMARDSITQQRGTFEQQAQTLTERERRLKAREQAIIDRHRELERRLRDGENIVQDIEERENEVAVERAQLDDARQELLRDREALQREQQELAYERSRLEETLQARAAERDALIAKQAQLDDRWQSAGQQQHELTRQREELEAWRRSLEQEQAACDQRIQRVERQELQFQTQLEDLEAQRRELAEREASVAGQEEQANKLFEEAQRVAQQAREQQDESAALREQLASRENEVRQAELSLALDREQLEKDQQSLEMRHRDYGTRHESQRVKLDNIRAQVREELDRVEKLAKPRQETTGGWWVRTGVLSLAAGLAAGLAMIGFGPVDHVVSVPVAATIAAGDPGRVLERHRIALMDAALLDNSEQPDTIRTDWAQACAEGKLAVLRSEEANQLIVQMRGASPAEMRGLLDAAVGAYVERVNSRSVRIDDPEHYDRLRGRLAELEGRHGTLEPELVRVQAELAGVPAVTERDALMTEVDARETELEELVKELNGMRAELAGLVAADVPRGRVQAETVTEALAQDEIYQEDVAELHAVAVQYRTELAVAMLQVVDPTKAVRTALRRFSATLAEQRELDPPADVLAVLDDCDERIAKAAKEVDALAGRWNQWLQMVQNADVREGVVGLVERQAEAADAARRLGDQAIGLVDELGVLIEQINNEGDGSTRGVIVAAVLRGDLGGLAQSVESFLEAAKKPSVPGNFELEAQDRKLRGLKTRLAQRRQAVEEQLQAAANRAARNAHMRRVEALRQKVHGLERRREEIAIELASALRSLREMDRHARRRMTLESERDRIRADLAWLSEQIAETRDALDAIEQGGESPDRLAAGDTVVESDGRGRLTLAGVVGGGAMVLVWLGAATSLVRIPSRRHKVRRLATRLEGDDSAGGS